MAKQIKDYTADELSAKIKALKEKRELTAKELNQYEEELKRREAWLGVPVEDNTPAHCFASYGFNFTSTESQLMFSKRLKRYVKALQEIAKGDPIDIEVLKPLMMKGWVAMDEDGDWYWYEKKPHHWGGSWGVGVCLFRTLSGFNIKPVENWKNSLQECGL